MRKKRFIVAAVLGAALFGAAAPAETRIGSIQENYFSALALVGIVQEPTMNYRSLSDSAEADFAAGPWKAALSSRPRSPVSSVDIVDPVLFSSFNTAYPHGGNDGALWQGVGANASLSGGAKIAIPYFSATFAPTLTFSQNADFDIMPSVVTGSDGYGYFWNGGIDLYQRPGSDTVYGFDWGDSEIRLDWRRLTIGFGTQAIWIGPAHENAIILSNNAAPFPKLDFGLRRTKTPIGDVEARAVLGFLSESEYFDDDPENDRTVLSLMSVSWEPRFAPGLVFGFHRSLIANSDGNHLENTLKFFQGMGTSFGKDEADQRASITARYLLPESGFEAYVEWAKNDYSPNLDYLMRYLFHAQAYTVGVRKAFILHSSDSILVAAFEISNTESSRDYVVMGWKPSFYAHHIVTHGYTNLGQILGAAIGSGGNSQHFGLDLFTAKGALGFFVRRANRDNDYVYFLDFDSSNSSRYNTELSLGASGLRLLNHGLYAGAGLAFCMNLNPLYNPDDNNSTVLNNLYATATIGWMF